MLSTLNSSELVSLAPVTPDHDQPLKNSFFKAFAAGETDGLVASER